MDLTRLRLLLLDPFPEDDRRRSLTPADVTTQRPRLSVSDPVGGLEGGAAQQENVHPSIRTTAHEVLRQGVLAAAPRLPPRDGATFKAFDDSVSDPRIGVGSHTISRTTRSGTGERDCAPSAARPNELTEALPRRAAAKAHQSEPSEFSALDHWGVPREQRSRLRAGPAAHPQERKMRPGGSLSGGKNLRF